jgi:hypothetical protein
MHVFLAGGTYPVAEYSAGHYSAEYSADRVVGRSLDSMTQKVE